MNIDPMKPSSLRFAALITAFFASILPISILAQDAPLRIGDTIQLRISGVPGEEVAQVSADYTVDAEGNVNLPHLGKLQAGGLSAGQLQTAIESAYKRSEIYTNPTIIISQQGSARTVNVGGEVKAPQRVAYTADLTLHKAIIAAGDFTEYSDSKKVRLLRGKEAMVVDVKRIRKDPSLDIPLKPGDDILVPQTWW